MRIRSVAIAGHPGLGDLDVDFCTAPDAPAPQTVVIAGQNGTGKTALLEVIRGTLDRDVHAPRARRVAIDLDLDERFQGCIGSGENGRGADFDIARPLTVVIEHTPPNGIVRTYRWTASSGDPAVATITLNVTHFGSVFLWRPFPVLFSEATVGFDVPPINSWGTIDPMGQWAHRPGTTLPRGGAQLGAEIARLLVDLRTADAEDLQHWVEEHPGEVPPANLANRRWSRFSDVFSYMLPRKRLLTVDRTREGYRVVFEEDGRRSTLETLSTGEKQIVFRGGYLLEFIEELSNAVVLVDEALVHKPVKSLKRFNI